jgi:transcriptional regulator with XRE-family HTH domain
MSISAYLIEKSAGKGRARKPRRSILLDAQGALPSGEAASVTIHNISETGMLVECAQPLGASETLAVDLPGAQATRATVVWSSGALHGCAFASPLSQAVLSAAQLRSAVTSGSAEGAAFALGGAEPFPERLQRLRKARGLTLAELADRLGVSKPTVWAWEQGRSRPIEERIAALAEALGVPPGELLSGRDEAELAGVLDRSRKQIADAFGITPESVRIMIEL